jgi:hypothetical protein
MSYFVCHEVSKSGNLHAHAKIFHPFDYNWIYSIAANAEINKQAGEYLDSIISTEFSSTRIFDKPEPERPGFKDPNLVWFNDTMPDASMKSKLPIPGPNDIETEKLDPFWTIFEIHGYIIQYHGNHNFSCWKDGAKECRFKFPEHAWNQISSFIQIMLQINKDNVAKPDIKIFERVSEPEISENTNTLNKIEEDIRIILFKSIKRTDDNADIRTLVETALNTQENIIYEMNTLLDDKKILKNDDTGRNNGMVVPCSAIILVIALCHNNVQLLSRLSMGAMFYIGGYMGKGVGKLSNVLPLIHSALTLNVLYKKSSIHPDVNTNPLRPALYILQQTLNNVSRKLEFPLTLMLAFLLGMKQFNSSHRFLYLNIYKIRKELMQYLKELDNIPGMNLRDPDDFDTKVDDVEDSEEEPDENPNLEFVELYDNEHFKEDNLDLDPNYYKITGDIVYNVVHHQLEIVNSFTDYKYRSKDLQHLNLLEFLCLFKKRIMAIDDIHEAADQADNTFDEEDIINLYTDDKNENKKDDIVDLAEDGSNTLDSPRKKRKTGPKDLKIYKFHADHPQHKICASFLSQIRIPLLTGKILPKYPKKSKRTSSKDTTKLEDFGSYFITLICPWIYENDKIILEYPPTHQGLLDWIIQKNVANLDEREQIVNSFPHKNRVNYVTRCMESTYSNKIEQIATSTFRRQSTDSKETYENNQKLGIPHGHDNQNEDNIDFSSYSVVRNTDDVIDIISNLRYEHGEETTEKKQKIC